jgi:hypothetical protein
VSIFTSCILFLRDEVSFPKSKISTILESIGNKSYSIYLVHLPLIYLAKEAPLPINFRIHKILTFLALALSFLAGDLLYRKVEIKYRSRSICEKDSNAKKSKLAIFVGFILLMTLPVIVIGNREGVIFSGADVKKNTEWDSNCKLRFDPNPCRYNWKAKGQTVLLIGDSHAAMFGKIFYEISRENDIRIAIWARPACQYFISPESLDANHFSSDCARSNWAIRNWVRRNNPDKIVLSIADTEMYKNVLGLNPNSMRNLILDSFGRIDFGKGEKAIILPTPRIPKYSILSYEMSRGSFQISKPSNVQNLIWKKMSKDRGIETVDSFSMICPQGVCRKERNGRIIFSDFDHLTFYGSQLLRSTISRFII